MSKLIQISIEMWLEKIAAPAADFSPEEMACLEVEMLGKRMHTTDILLNFPLVFDQRITFKRMYKHATIMRAVEHLYHDPLSIKVLRRSGGCHDGVTVARFDGSTGNTLLNENGAASSPNDTHPAQELELRICVEGFCFRPKLTFSSFVTFREIAASPARYETLPRETSIPGMPANVGRRQTQDRRDNEPSREENIERRDQQIRREDVSSAPATLPPEKSASPPARPAARPATEPVKPSTVAPPVRQDLFKNADWNEMCERPPFVVRHVESTTRKPKLHKTMSQETNLMLMQYQLDHPFDDSVQKVCPNKVPVRLYRKLRRQYEEKHLNAPKQQFKKPPGPKIPCRDKFACEVPRLNVVKATNKTKPTKTSNKPPLKSISEHPVNPPRETTTPAEFTVGEEPLPRRALTRVIPEAPPRAVTPDPTEASDGVSLDPGNLYTLGDVKKFMKRAACQTGQAPDAARGDHARMRPSRDEAAWPTGRSQSTGKRSVNMDSCLDEEESVFGDDRELAAVYREVTRTLQRDLVRRERLIAGDRK